MIKLRLPALDAKVSGDTTPVRMWLLCAVAVLLGLIGGGAAVGLFKLIGLITHLVLLHDVGTSLPTLRHYSPPPTIVITALGGALLVSILAAWSPVIRGHGIPESLETILVRESRIAPRAALAKPLSAAITIGTGGPFGAEGPIIVTAGSLGSLIGQLLSTSPIERRIMLATGAAAGMAGTFNAPIASIILALELVLFERSLRTTVPLAIGCGIAAAIHTLVFGSTPLFAIHQSLHVGLGQLPLFAVLGLAAGALAVVLSKGLFAAEAMFRRLPVKIFWWPLIGALGFSLIGLLVPRSLSMGYSAISDTLNGRFVLGALAVLFAAKLLSWWISLASQTSGGTLAPMFLIGAIMGSLFGHGLDTLAPGLHAAPAAYALVAMGATFGAAAKAPFTGVVFAFEVTGQYRMVVPLMIGMAAAELVAQLFLTDRLMTEKLSHRGFRVDFRSEVDPLRMKVVGQIMRAPVTLSLADDVSQARRTLAAVGVSTAAVLDGDGRYGGVVTAADLAAWQHREGARLAPAATFAGTGGPSGNGRSPRGAGGPSRNGQSPPAAELARRQRIDSFLIRRAPAPNARDFVVEALALLIEHELEELPVLDGDRVVGRVSRGDIAAERLRSYRDLEAKQAGWLSLLAVRLRARRDPVGWRRARREPVLSRVGSLDPVPVDGHPVVAAARAIARGADPLPPATERTPAAATAEPVSPLSDEDYRRLLAFRSGLSRYLEWSDGRIREAGITPGQYQIMLGIRELALGTDGPSIHELAQLLHRRIPAVAEAMEGALAAALIEGEPDPIDARIVRWRLTPLGETCLAGLVSLHVAAVERHPPSLQS